MFEKYETLLKNAEEEAAKISKCFQSEEYKKLFIHTIPPLSERLVNLLTETDLQ